MLFDQLKNSLNRIFIVLNFDRILLNLRLLLHVDRKNRCNKWNLWQYCWHFGYFWLLILDRFHHKWLIRFCFIHYSHWWLHFFFLKTLKLKINVERIFMNNFRLTFATLYTFVFVHFGSSYIIWFLFILRFYSHSNLT